MTGEHVVVDDAALLDLLVTTDLGVAVQIRLEGCLLHAPSSIDAEVAAGLARLARMGVIGRYPALDHLEALVVAPIERHPLPELLEGAWRYRNEVPLSQALYLELAGANGMTLITTDPRLAHVSRTVVHLIGR